MQEVKIKEPVKVKEVKANPFETKILGKKKITHKIFTDPETGLAVEIKDLYPGQELELMHKMYKLKDGFNWDDVKETKAEGKNTENMMELNLAEVELKKLVLRIIRWNLTDDKKALLPVNYETIKTIENKYFVKIKKWISEFDKEINSEDGELKN